MERASTGASPAVADGPGRAAPYCRCRGGPRRAISARLPQAELGLAGDPAVAEGDEHVRAVLVLPGHRIGRRPGNADVGYVLAAHAHDGLDLLVGHAVRDLVEPLSGCRVGPLTPDGLFQVPL